MIEKHLHEQVVAQVGKRKHAHMRINWSVSTQALLIKVKHSEWSVTSLKYCYDYEESCYEMVDVAIDEDDCVVSFFLCFLKKKCGTEHVFEREVSNPIETHEENECADEGQEVFGNSRL